MCARWFYIRLSNHRRLINFLAPKKHLSSKVIFSINLHQSNFLFVRELHEIYVVLTQNPSEYFILFLHKKTWPELKRETWDLYHYYKNLHLNKWLVPDLTQCNQYYFDLYLTTWHFKVTFKALIYANISLLFKGNPVKIFIYVPYIKY